MKTLELTMFIPTYNRVDKLERTLKFINSFRKEYQFKILVGNNASTDKTELFLEDNFRFFDFSFYSNIGNEGITSNIYRGINEVQTTWIWIFGDDDFFHPKTLEILYDNQGDSKRGFYFNRENFKVFNEELLKEEKKSDVDEFCVDETNVVFAVKAGFISSFIFKTEHLKEIYNTVLKADKRLYNNAYTPKLAALLYHQRYGLNISKETLVFQDVSNGSHFTQNIQSVFDVFVKDELFVYLKLQEYGIDYLPVYRRFILRETIVRPFYFYKMLKGASVNSELKSIIKAYQLPYFYKMIVCIPAPILKSFYNTYKSLKKIFDVFVKKAKLSK